jgi:hypothetical protein
MTSGTVSGIGFQPMNFLNHSLEADTTFVNDGPASDTEALQIRRANNGKYFVE